MSRRQKWLLVAIATLLAIVIGGNIIDYNRKKQLRVADAQVVEVKPVVKQETIKPVKVAPKKVTVTLTKPKVTKQLTISENAALKWIIAHEGGPTSVNRSSLACGIAQSLPCSKVLKYAGVDMTKYNLNTYAGVKAAISTVPVEVQRKWMILYCQQRYGSVAKAQQAWIRQGWY